MVHTINLDFDQPIAGVVLCEKRFVRATWGQTLILEIWTLTDHCPHFDNNLFPHLATKTLSTAQEPSCAKEGLHVPPGSRLPTPWQGQ